MNNGTSRPRENVRSKPQRSRSHNVNADEAARPAPATKLPNSGRSCHRSIPRPPSSTAGHMRKPQRHMAATANPLGSKNNEMRLPMLGSEEPRAPLTNIAAKTLNDLISSAPEERSTRFNASTTDLLPLNRSDRSTFADAYTVNPIGM